MTKNIKFIAPLALVAFGTLASCGGTGGKKASEVFPHLKRVEYAPSTIGKYDELIKGIFTKQYKGTAETAMVFDKGTMRLNYAVSLSGDITYFSEGIAPIDVSGISLAEQNTITFAWSKTDEYIKMTSKDDTGYIIHSSIDGKWYRCFDLGDKGKFKTDITHMHDAYKNKSFDEFVVGEAKATNGLFAKKMGVSLGLTGQGRNPELTHYMFGTQSNTPKAIAMYELPEVIDSDTLTLIETGLGIVSSLYENKTIAVASNDVDSLSTNIAIKNLDFGKAKDKYTDIVSMLESLGIDVPPQYKNWPKGLELSGLGNLDYFFAYFDDLIKQHEFILDLDDINVLYDHLDGEFPEYIKVDADASIYVGQEVTKDECQIDKVNLEDYTTFNF